MKWNIKYERTTNLFDDLIKSRNIDLKKFTSNSLSDLKNPSEIPYINVAAKRIIEAVISKEKIYVYGDFDVDGTAATAILWGYLNSLSANVMPFIPNRVDEGYGMSEKTLTHLKNEGANLIISVDCGIRDIELVETARKMSLEIIITDHHEFVKDEKGNSLLPNTIVVHSKHPESSYECVLSGGATAWKLICAIEQILTGTALTQKTLSYLEYACITTITDIMPLVDENRVIVKLGIEKLRKTKKPGLLKLFEIASIDQHCIDTYHIGYVIGPRLNAPGRVDNSAMDSLRLLCTNDDSKARELATKLDGLNKIRQDWTLKYLALASDQINLQEKILFINGQDWPEGIVGLVAGKLTEKYGRPTLVSTHNTKENKITGSARSIKGINIVDIITKASKSLTRFGGHKAAAGFALLPENLDKFHNDLFKVANELISDKELEQVLDIDFEIKSEDLNIEFIDSLELLMPYGNANSSPVFALYDMKISDIKKLGKNNEHLKLKICSNGMYFDVIGFNYDKQNVNLGDSIKIAFTAKKNEWNGKTNIQLEIKDLKLTTYSN